MPHFKDAHNQLYWLDDHDVQDWKNPEWIPITDSEAEALRPKPPEPTYVGLRAAEYPPYTDYLDGLVKGDEAQMQAYIDKCLAIKAKYPKPV